MRTLRFWLLLALVGMLALAGCGPRAAGKAGEVEIRGPWIRPAAAGGSTAAYMQIKNGANQPDRLVSAEFAPAGMVELMDTTIVDDRMQMVTISEIEIPAGGQVELKPGGLHVMLMNLKEDLVEGQTAALTLTFEQGGSVTLELPVKMNP